MGILIQLDPGQLLMMGKHVIRNADRRTRFYVESKGPLLRGSMIMQPEDANTPAKQIYLKLQLMYLSESEDEHHPTYAELLRTFVRAHPAILRIASEMNALVLIGEHFKALKFARELIDYEAATQDTASPATRLVAREAPLVIERVRRRSEPGASRNRV